MSEYLDSRKASNNLLDSQVFVKILTAVENGGAGRSKMVALGGIDLP